MVSLCERLKELRTQKGYSVRKLAELSNVSKSAINMYEKGECHPKYEALVSIANALNVSIDYLLGKTDNPQKKSGLRIGARINSSIAHNIQRHREEAGLTQKQFADLLGVDEDAVDAMESGLYDLSKEMLYKICDVLYLIPGNIMPRDTDELDEDAEYLLSRRNALSPEAQEFYNLISDAPEEELQRLLNFIESIKGLTDEQFEKVMAFARFVQSEGK